LKRIGRGTVGTVVSDRTPIERVREICLGLPDVTERLSHGSPMPYLGHRGWVGAHLNRGLDWNEIAGAIEESR
jgi:hypothetical protein